mmetsp:Transcript_33139/g.72250  ORF Transcript_33139/g.72250 Transcript_33139/m.72250 type:complete len:495 (+) Transcript_33139:458-1942(+)
MFSVRIYGPNRVLACLSNVVLADESDYCSQEHHSGSHQEACLGAKLAIQDTEHDGAENARDCVHRAVDAHHLAALVGRHALHEEDGDGGGKQRDAHHIHQRRPPQQRDALHQPDASKTGRDEGEAGDAGRHDAESLLHAREDVGGYPERHHRQRRQQQPYLLDLEAEAAGGQHREEGVEVGLPKVVEEAGEADDRHDAHVPLPQRACQRLALYTVNLGQGGAGFGLVGGQLLEGRLVQHHRHQQRRRHRRGPGRGDDERQAGGGPPEEQPPQHGADDVGQRGGGLAPGHEFGHLLLRRDVRDVRLQHRARARHRAAQDPHGDEDPEGPPLGHRHALRDETHADPRQRERQHRPPPHPVAQLRPHGEREDHPQGVRAREVPDVLVAQGEVAGEGGEHGAEHGEAQQVQQHDAESRVEAYVPLRLRAVPLRRQLRRLHRCRAGDSAGAGTLRGGRWPQPFGTRHGRAPFARIGSDNGARPLPAVRPHPQPGSRAEC